MPLPAKPSYPSKSPILNNTFEYSLLKKVSYLALTPEPKVLESQTTVSLYFYLFYLCVCAHECAPMLSVCSCAQKVKIGDQIPGAKIIDGYKPLDVGNGNQTQI